MAQRRMFNKTVTNNDIFLEMPDSSQNLYFHLSMNADDDGFIDNWKSIMRMTGHKDDDLKLLIAKNYVIPFESGVIVIKHWRLNNYLQKDRITPTNYKKEKSQLIVNNNNVYEMYTKCIHSIDENSIDENSIDENSIDENSIDENREDEEKQEQEYQTPSASELFDDQQEREEKTTESSSSVGIEDRQENKTPLIPSLNSLDRPQDKTTKANLELFEYLEKNFGRTISPREYEIISSYQDTFSLEIIKEAIDRACINNAKTIRYVMGILNSWKSKGYKKIEECRSEFSKNKNNYNPQTPEWFDKKIPKSKSTQKEQQEMEELLREYR